MTYVNDLYSALYALIFLEEMLQLLCNYTLLEYLKVIIKLLNNMLSACQISINLFRQMSGR